MILRFFCKGWWANGNGMFYPHALQYICVRVYSQKLLLFSNTEKGLFEIECVLSQAQAWLQQCFSSGPIPDATCIYTTLALHDGRKICLATQHGKRMSYLSKQTAIYISKNVDLPSACLYPQGTTWETFWSRKPGPWSDGAIGHENTVWPWKQQWSHLAPKIHVKT